LETGNVKTNGNFAEMLKDTRLLVNAAEAQCSFGIVRVVIFRKRFFTKYDEVYVGCSNLFELVPVVCRREFVVCNCSYF